MNRTESEQKNWEILVGGTTIKVLIANPDQTLSEQDVKVRKIPLKELPKLGAAMEDVEKEAAFYTGRDVDFISTLAPDSALEIVTEGRRLNAKSFAAWFAHRSQQAEMMGIDLRAVIQSAAKKDLATATESR